MKYGYISFEENIIKYNPVNSTEKDFSEYCRMNKLFNTQVLSKNKNQSEINYYIELLKPIKDNKPIKDFQRCKNKEIFFEMISSFDFEIKNKSAFSKALLKISPKNTFKNSEQIRNKFK